MKAEIFLTLTRDEINTEIPYAIICETMGGSKWNTGKCKKLKREWFSEKEIAQFSRLHQMAYTWYLKKGVPDEIKITTKTLLLFQKLGDFCYSL